MKNVLRGLLCMLAVLPLEATPIEATFVGVNGAIGFGYYVGPYYGKLEQQSVVLDCVDFANDVSFGQQWAANLSHINTQSDLGNTRFGSRLNATQLYQEAAWLTIQYSLNPSAYADIQAEDSRAIQVRGTVKFAVILGHDRGEGEPTVR